MKDTNSENEIKGYILYIKSHCEAPDFEAITEAKNKKEALKNFRKQHLNLSDNFEDDFLLEHIEEDEEY